MVRFSFTKLLGMGNVLVKKVRLRWKSLEKLQIGISDIPH